MAPQGSGGPNRTATQVGGGGDPTPQKVLNTSWNSGRSQKDNIMAPQGSGGPNRTATQVGGGIGTAALQAFQYGYPLLDLELPNQTQTFWPPDVQGPDPGRQYVWSVQALRDDGRPVGGNGGTAQPFSFGIAPTSPPEDDPAGDFPVPDFVLLSGGCYHYLYGDGAWVVGECPLQPGGPLSAPSRLEVAADRSVFADGNSDPILRLADGKELEDLVQSRFALANKIPVSHLIVAPQGGEGEPAVEGVNGTVKVGSIILEKNAAGNTNDNTPQEGDPIPGWQEVEMLIPPKQAPQGGGTEPAELHVNGSVKIGSLILEKNAAADANDDNSQANEELPGYEELLEEYVLLFNIGENTYALRKDGQWGQLRTAIPVQKISCFSRCYYAYNAGTRLVNFCDECHTKYPNLKFLDCKPVCFYGSTEIKQIESSEVEVPAEHEPPKPPKSPGGVLTSPGGNLQLYNQAGRIKYQQEDGTYLDVTAFYDAGNLTSRSPKEVTVCKDSAGNWADVKSDCEACPTGTASCMTFTIGVNALKILRN
jgi:hypothetical protein